MSHLSFMDKLLDGVKVEWKSIGQVTLPTSNIKWRDVNRTYRYIDLTSVGIQLPRSHAPAWECIRTLNHG